MCFSERLSYTALVIGISGIVASSARAESERKAGKRIAAQQRLSLTIVGISIVAMQLYEGLMWRLQRLNQPRSALLENATMGTVLLQALLIGIVSCVVKFLNPLVFSTTEAVCLTSVTALYTIFAAQTFLSKVNNMKPILPNDCAGTLCRLNWDWSDNMSITWLFYYIVVFSCLASIRPFSSAATLTSFMIMTIVVAWFFMPKPFGSKWCFIGVALPWLVFAVPLSVDA